MIPLAQAIKEIVTTSALVVGIVIGGYCVTKFLLWKDAKNVFK